MEQNIDFALQEFEYEEEDFEEFKNIYLCLYDDRDPSLQEVHVTSDRKVNGKYDAHSEQ
jgi:hypothetical protein